MSIMNSKERKARDRGRKQGYTKAIEDIRRWCVDNSIIDYEEDYSYGGDCIIVLSKLEKFLNEIEPTN